MNVSRFKHIENEIMSFHVNISDPDTSLFIDTDETVICELQSATGKKLDILGCEIHHQIDPSYQ